MRDRIGVDIVSVTRVQALLDLHGSELARRLLTERELRDSTGAQGLLAHSVAGRIAAKEAVFKLFHEGAALLPWMHIAVVRGPSGAPVVRLTGRALTLAEASRLGPVSLSTSHDEGYAIAFATAALMSGTTPGIGPVRPPVRRLIYRYTPQLRGQSCRTILARRWRRSPSGSCGGSRS